MRSINWRLNLKRVRIWRDELIGNFDKIVSLDLWTLYNDIELKIDNDRMFLIRDDNRNQLLEETE